jgi:hypothetical protein
MSGLRGIAKEEAQELFYYKDGKLFNKQNRGGGATEGKEAGNNVSTNYKKIMIRGFNYYTHRLIWILHNGDIPEGLQIDHINGDKFDNRLENLRLVTHQENGFNRINSKGFYWQKGRCIAQIWYENQNTYLGSFDSEGEARQAYLEAKQDLHIIRDRRGAFLCP